ncbi:MAG: exodeoxyribonuclease VII large subunit, partial [Desulfatirhabdiaceae bacterium]
INNLFMNKPVSVSDHRHIFSVAELTENIKVLLEDKYPFLWISGEISNLHRPSSGHYYFTLKDETAQISGVMFKGQAKNLAFDLEDGQHIIGMGRISVYSPRGAYQIILEYMEPKGIGALLLAYEKSKAGLAAEGLFDLVHKKPIPFLPQAICVITSPTGSVIHDILHIAGRRFHSVPVQIIPVKVQGDGADAEIVRAVELANRYAHADVIILARGGGSLEDLAAFNSEAVARAVFASRIPIISAVGHETDFTITDFVADLRAPTPSAAAELALPDKNALIARNTEQIFNLKRRIFRQVEYSRQHLNDLKNRMVHPVKRIQDSRLRIDELLDRLNRATIREITRGKDVLNWKLNSLNLLNPIRYIHKYKPEHDGLYHNLIHLITNQYNSQKNLLQQTVTRLHSASPVAILSRGYSITRTVPDARVIRNSESVHPGQQVEIRLASGALLCRVERIVPNGQTDF